MHVGPLLTPAPPDLRAKTRRRSVCLVAESATALAAADVGNDIQGLRALGHDVVPVAVEAGTAPARPDVVRLAEVETLAALAAAAANPAGLAAAVGFAQRQPPQPRRVLLRAAARLAHVARARGCTHIHAHSTRSAAAIAICAARIAGLTVSLAGHGADPGRPAPDLELKLAAADLTITDSDELAAAFRRLVPHAHVLALPAGAAAARQAARLAAAFDALHR
jgi:hypothetical protein